MQTDGSGGFGSGLTEALGDLRGLSAGFRSDLSEVTAQMREMDGETQRLARSLGSSLRSALDKAIFGGGKLSDVFKGLARDVAGKALDAALRPVQSALGGGLASLGTSLPGLLGFAKGGAFSAGNVRAFANGGVVSGPTLFPMRSGTGLMGEAGPEAIMPLTRGPDGRLGVAAAGGGAGPAITVNISTPDVAGFQRSRGQVAAQLARAVQRGSSRL